MAYCSRCGVAVDEQVDACPLCSAPIQRLDSAGVVIERADAAENPAEVAAAHMPTEPSPYPTRPRRTEALRLHHLLWLVATAAIATAALISVTVDLVTDRAATWSLPTLAGMVVVWGFATLVMAFARRPIYIIAGQAVTTSGFLLVADLVDDRAAWFMSLGLPIVAVVTAVCVGVAIAWRLARGKAWSVAAAVLIAAAVGCLGIDGLVSAHRGMPGIRWSLIATAALVPPAVFLLWVQWRLAPRIDLRRILHS